MALTSWSENTECQRARWWLGQRDSRAGLLLRPWQVPLRDLMPGYKYPLPIRGRAVPCRQGPLRLQPAAPPAPGCRARRGGQGHTRTARRLRAVTRSQHTHTWQQTCASRTPCVQGHVRARGVPARRAEALGHTHSHSTCPARSRCPAQRHTATAATRTPERIIAPRTEHLTPALTTAPTLTTAPPH